jgi:hypothetical protein
MSENPLSLRSSSTRRIKPEKKYTELVKTKLEELGCLVEKLHGSEFQSGLPDLLVAVKTGQLCLIELKHGEASTVGELLNRLERRQRSLIPLWGLRSPVWMLCGSSDGHRVVQAGRRDFETVLKVHKNLSDALQEIIHETICWTARDVRQHARRLRGAGQRD